MRPAIVVVGASLGGFRALESVLGPLPGDFSIPIAVVIHRHPASSDLLGKQLERAASLPVVEAEDKQPIGPGIHLAPADYHLLVDTDRFALSLEGPVAHARPSVDVLFESAADAYGARVLGIVLTGANHDGARGTSRILSEGGRVVAQAPETAEARAMPKAAIAAGADVVLPMDDIAAWLIGQEKGGWVR